jgi:hypothetical protein
MRLRFPTRLTWCAHSALAHKVPRPRWTTETWTGPGAQRSYVLTQICASKPSQAGFRNSPRAILPATTIELSMWLPPWAGLCSLRVRLQPSHRHLLLLFFLLRHLLPRRLRSGRHRRRLRSRQHRRPWWVHHHRRRVRRAAIVRYAELCTTCVILLNSGHSSRATATWAVLRRQTQQCGRSTKIAEASSQRLSFWQ